MATTLKTQPKEQAEAPPPRGFPPVEARLWPSRPDQLGAMALEPLPVERLAMLGALLPGIAHELSNPLAYVIANLNAVRGVVARFPPMPGVDLEDLRAALDESAEGAERVRQIVSDLKALARTGRRACGPIDVRSTLLAALDLVRAETKHRALVVTNLDEVSAVLADEAQLGQLFLALLLSATQTMPSGAASTQRLVASTEMRDGWVTLTVEDTGLGLDPDARSRPGEVPVLTIARAITLELGGTLSVQTEPGRGTAVTVRLPPCAGAGAADGDTSAEAAPLPSPPTPALHAGPRLSPPCS
jgi:two-component system NtrC family sensor kinase